MNQTASKHFSRPKVFKKDSEASFRFRAYLNYLSSISGYLQRFESNPLNSLRSTINSRAFLSIKPTTNPDLERIGKLLRLAWVREIQITPYGIPPDLLSIQNHSAAVNAYFCLHRGLRAFFIARNNRISDNHTGILKSISWEMLRRPELYPFPWKVLCTGTNVDVDKFKFEQLPTAVSVSKILEEGEPDGFGFWNSYCLFLRTTRDKQIRKKLDMWRKQTHKSRLTPVDKTTAIGNLHPTSLFDCLYRLRCTSDYDNADSFLAPDRSTIGAEEFNKSVQTLVACSMLLIELLTAKYLGKKNYESIIMNLQRNPKWRLLPNVAQRSNVILGLID